MEHSGSDETSARSSEQEKVLDEVGDDNVAANANTDDDIHEADLGNTRADVYLKSLREMEKLSTLRRLNESVEGITNLSETTAMILRVSIFVKKNYA